MIVYLKGFLPDGSKPVYVAAARALNQCEDSAEARRGLPFSHYLLLEKLRLVRY